MRIAMIGHKAVPAVSGGVERHVEEIAIRLADAGHDVTLYNRLCIPNTATAVCDRRNAQLPERYEGISLRWIRTPAIKGFEAFVYSILASIDAVSKGFDIIHYHAVGPAFASFIPKAAGRRTVVTVHGLDWERARWGMTAKIFLRLAGFVSSRCADGIIVVSRKLKDYFMEAYGRDTVYITNGVTKPLRAEPDIIRRFGLEKGKYALFLARLVPEKGCHYLIDAFKRLKTGNGEASRQIKLAVAGRGPDEKYCRRLAEMAGTDVIFTGDAGDELKKELYSNALFYILPSDMEGCPISLLEAMSYGLCPLVSDITENLEVILEGHSNRSYGFSFPAGDVCSLAESMKYMLDNPEMVNEKALTAASHVSAAYDWDTAAGELLDVYERLCLCRNVFDTAAPSPRKTQMKALFTVGNKVPSDIPLARNEKTEQAIAVSSADISAFRANLADFRNEKM